MYTLKDDQERRALELHRRAIVIDTHCDSLDCSLRGERRLGERSEYGHVDIPRLLEGGVTAQVFATGLDPFGLRPRSPLHQFLHYVDTLHREVREFPDLMLIATTADDIRRAKVEGKVACILSMEDAAQLEGDIDALLPLQLLGLKAIGLVWGPPNEVGIGVTGVPILDRTLTRFGRELVGEMNRLKLLVDVAHINEAGFWDVMEHNAGPVINSHANARALVDHPRNMTDEQIKAIAGTGGVIHVVFAYLRGDEQQPSVNDVLDHIDHICNLVGPEYVGIGSDYDALPDRPPKGLEDATKFTNITRGLVARGYTDDEILGILGCNFVRVLESVE